MKKQSKVFRTRFQMLIEAQLDLLKNDDWDHLMEYNVEPILGEEAEEPKV